MATYNPNNLLTILNQLTSGLTNLKVNVDSMIISTRNLDNNIKNLTVAFLEFGRKVEGIIDSLGTRRGGGQNLSDAEKKRRADQRYEDYMEREAKKAKADREKFNKQQEREAQKKQRADEKYNKFRESEEKKSKKERSAFEKKLYADEKAATQQTLNEKMADLNFFKKKGLLSETAGGIGGALGGAIGGGYGLLRGGILGGIGGGLRGAGVGATQNAAYFGEKGSGAGELAATGIFAALKTFTGILSFGIGIVDGLIGSFMKFTFAVAGFVAAYNPALAKQFSMTLKDVQAVIGAGLQPVLSAITLTFRTLGDYLIPIIEKLGPSFDAIGKAIISYLVPVFKGLSSVVNTLAPALNNFFAKVQDVTSALGNLISQGLIALTPTFELLINMASIVAQMFTVLFNVLGRFVDVVAPAFLGAIVGLSAWLGVRTVMALVAFNAALVAATASLRAQQAAQATESVGQAFVKGATAGGTAGSFGGPKAAFITAAVFAAIAVAGNLLGRLFASEQKGAEKADSTGAAAREASYMGVADLSRNLIKAGFSGSTNDRLRNIDIKAGQQVELLQQLVDAKQPKVVVNVGEKRVAGVLV